jgi:hypothetical protein
MEPGIGAFSATMTLAIVLVIIAALSLVIILRVSASRSLEVPGETSLAGQIQPIDVEAFRNLVDPAEDEYLRRRLLPRQFRKVRRERLRATAAYVQAAGRNASLLVRIGSAALESGDERISEAAHRLVNDALLLQRNATYAMLKIYVARAVPAVDLTASPVLNSYEGITASAMLLGRLQNPAAPVRIAAHY